MKYDPNKHHRRSIRLKHYDYASLGAYFVTICTYNRQCLFGQITDGKMVLNDAGREVEHCWNEIPAHFPHVALDEFVVMPNHVHGIIVITVGVRHAVPLPNPVQPKSEHFQKPIAGSIPTIIRSFKSAVTKRINQTRKTPGVTLWQRNYYERIIRNENEMNTIRQYIINNPLNWRSDENYKL
jgi:putative transposase